jgi:hypothetical protein
VVNAIVVNAIVVPLRYIDGHWKKIREAQKAGFV